MKKNILIIFVIPLIIGIIVALFEFVLPKLTKDKEELSYHIATPISLIDNEITNNIDITVNGKKTQYLYNIQIDIENTGNIPLKNIPISLIFQNIDTNFTIYNYNLLTEPKYEFGKIDVTKAFDNIRLIVTLINVGDKIHLSVFTNKDNLPKFYSKAENMKVLQKAEIKENKGIVSTIIGIVASLLSIIAFIIMQYKGIINFSLRSGGISINFETIEKAKKTKGLRIISASYGKDDKLIDVTEILNNLIIDNKVDILVGNKLFGDPFYGAQKELRVAYTYGSLLETKIVNENDNLTIPDINAT
jgi:hypothetical protein